MNTLPITELRALLAAVTQHGEHHLAEIETDLEQTKFLLNEAIEKLGASFMCIHGLISDYQQQVEAIVTPLSLEASKTTELTKLSVQIGEQVNAAVTGLQFQDMTNQLLQRTLNRVNGLSDLLQTLDSHALEMNADQEHEEILNVLQTLNNHWDTASHALTGNLRKSVGQRDMSTGDIDLF